jgi:hypothetical protein
MKPLISRCSSILPEKGLNKVLSLHSRHGHLISLLLLWIMSSVAWLKYLITVLFFIMTIFTCTVFMQENKKHIGCHSKFQHDLPTNKTDAESQFFVEMEMNQHFGNSFSSHQLSIKNTMQIHIYIESITSSHACNTHTIFSTNFYITIYILCILQTNYSHLLDR